MAQSSPPQVHDPARLHALRQTALLDTPTEEAFDRLTRLAAQMLHAPVALVSLVDDDRQFFKSCLGLPEPWASERETPLSHSFCQYTLMTNQPLVIEDARQHPIVHDNLAIRDLNVIAYVGIPLVTPDGHTLGSLCVIDTKPRWWTQRDIDLLSDLAASVLTAIELRVTVHELEAQAKAAERARKEQEALLESTGEGMYQIDLQGRCTFINHTAAEMLGYTPDELLGQDLHMVVHSKHADGTPYPTYECPIYRAMHTGQGVRIDDEVMWHRDGSAIPMEYSSYPVIVNDQIEGAVVALRDIAERKRADVRLRESEERYRLLADNATDVISRHTPDGTYVYASPSSHAVLGYDPNVLIGRSVYDIVHPDDIDHVRAAHTAMVARHETAAVVYRARCQSGQYVWLETVAHLIHNPQTNEIVEIQAASRDVTDRKRAEDAQHFLYQASATLVDSLDYETTLAQVAHLAVPQIADWCTVHVLENNTILRPAVAHSESDKEHLILDMQQRFPLALEWDHPITNVLRTGKSQMAEIGNDSHQQTQGIDPEHAQILEALGFTAYMVVPLTARGRTFGAITFAASSRERRYDDATLALAEELAHRAALAVDNARLYNEAQQTLIARDELLSIVSHDLNNPVGVIKGYTSLLRRRIARNVPQTPQEIDDSLAKVEAATSKMSMLLNELLDIARMQVNQPIDLVRKSTDLTALVRQVAAEQQTNTQRHTIRLITPATSLIGQYDTARMERVVANLIENAIKYSPSGGEIVVELSREQTDDQTIVLLKVCDQGLGIPANDLPHIFDRFYRAGNIRDAISGTGLGLASVQQVVTQHGGTISVDSSEGAGTTFEIRLPLTG